MDLWCLQWRGSLISALICVTSSLGSHVLPAWQNYISLKTCLTVDLDSGMSCPRILSAPHTPQPRDTPTWCSSSDPRDRSSCLCHPCHESWHGQYKRWGHPPAVTILQRHTSGSMGHIHKLDTTIRKMTFGDCSKNEYCTFQSYRPLLLLIQCKMCNHWLNDTQLKVSFL